MRKPRILGCRKVNYYHVMSRVVDRRYIFGEDEKEFFRQTMRKLESFMGVQVLTYCVMSNHWHILLGAPSSQNASIDDEKLLKRIHDFYPKYRAKELVQEFELACKHADETGSDVWLNEVRFRYLCRMNNLSSFVKELKERFSKWYNRRHNRRGTLWEERFKSVLVEDSEHAISTIAAYIDLNPVRAGLVANPQDYRFCGYAEAVAGGAEARRGITTAMSQVPETNWTSIAARYQAHLSVAGEATKNQDGISSELSLAELLRCRIRYFSDGVAIGNRLFVEEVFENNRELFSARRQCGARAMRGGEWAGLCSLRSPGHAVSAPG